MSGFHWFLVGFMAGYLVGGLVVAILVKRMRSL